MLTSRSLKAKNEKYNRKLDKQYILEEKIGAGKRTNFFREYLTNKPLAIELAKILPPPPLLPSRPKNNNLSTELPSLTSINFQFIHHLSPIKNTAMHRFIFFLLSLILLLNNHTAAEKIPPITHRKTKDNNSGNSNPVENDQNNSFALIPNQHTININSINPLSSMMTSCSVITAETILPFLTGNITPESITKMTTAIMDIRQADPVIAEYIDIVFNYLPKFKIKLVTQDEMDAILEQEERANELTATGGYNVRKQVMYITYNTEQQDYSRSLLIHEFRHAIMHVIQIAKTTSMTTSTQNYFPVTPTKEKKVMHLFKQGNDAINKLHKLLKQESNNTISEKDKKYLFRLRQLSKSSDKNIYFQTATITTNEGVFHQYFKNKIGKIINNHAIYKYGPIQVISFDRQKNGVYEVNCELTDLLWIIVNLHEKLLQRVAKYPTKDQCSEMDAHLFQHVPIPLLKKFYPKYFKYTQKLLSSTVYPYRLRTDSMPRHEFIYSHEYQILSSLIKPDNYLNPNQSDKILSHINTCITHHVYLDEGEFAAKSLIKNQLKVAEANLALGDIYHLKGEHETACAHYRKIFSQPIVIRADQLLQFAQSLLIIKNYKEAEKICAQCLKNTAALGWTKEKFEAISATAKKEMAHHNLQLGRKDL